MRRSWLGFLVITSSAKQQSLGYTTSPERRCLNLRWIWGGAGGNLAFCAYAHPPLLLYSNVLDDLGCSWCSSSRAATAYFWQVRPLKWQPHHRCAVAAITVFYSAKYWQDHGQSMTEAVFLTLGQSRSSHFKKLGLRLKAKAEAEGTKFCKFCPWNSFRSHNSEVECIS